MNTDRPDVGSLPDPPEPGSEGARLFDAMVRWRALSTTLILAGFAAGLAHLVYTGTSGNNGDGLARGLALIAVIGIAGAAISALVGFRARSRFLRWYRSQP
jgi:hypothetical protein